MPEERLDISLPWFDTAEISIDAYGITQVTLPFNPIDPGRSQITRAEYENKIVNLGYLPKNELECAYFETGSQTRSGNYRAGFGYIRGIDYFPSESYWSTLDNTSDPLEYIRTLRMFCLFGINLSPRIENIEIVFHAKDKLFPYLYS